MHLESYNLMGIFVNKYLDSTKKLNILDVGSYDQNGSYQNYFQNPLWKYTGCDIVPGPNVDFVMKDTYNIQVEDEKYDVVISGQTMEHVEFFWIWIKELVRVLKKGGIICIIAPGSGIIHQAPIDCWRFNVDGLVALAKWSNLNVMYTQQCNNIWRDTILIATKI